MAALSISRAWEGTKASIAADGRLMFIVAAALVALPGLIGAVVVPEAGSGEGSLASTLVILVTSILALVGQLAIIRLAVAPAVSVGEAITHGARRMPIYLGAAIILTLAFFVAMIPFAVILYALGVPLTPGNESAVASSPTAMLIALLYVALIVFICVRMLMTSPVASEETAGPLQIIRRSWELTSGHWLRLFGFILIFFIGAAIVVTAVNWGVSLVAVMLFGPIEAMSASALVVALVDSCMNAAVTVMLAVMLARMYLQLAVREAGAPGVPISGT